MYLLSSEDLRKINRAIENKEEEIEISLDLGKTKTKLRIEKDNLVFPNNEKVGITNIREDDKSCYYINNGLKKFQFFSKETNLFYKLVPTSNRPILKASATSMHKREFVERIEKDELKGNILDSGTGLGYTTIAASKTADKVTTIEWDKTVIEIAKLNPYSEELFKNKNIKIIISDFTEEVKKFNDNSFDNIILDAGTPRSSGYFFSLNNYKEVFRVLKENGKLYHYIPKHHLKKGRDFIAEVTERIKNAGFKIKENNIKGSYVIAEKLI